MEPFQQMFLDLAKEEKIESFRKNEVEKTKIQRYRDWYSYNKHSKNQGLFLRWPTDVFHFTFGVS